MLKNNPQPQPTPARTASTEATHQHANEYGSIIQPRWCCCVSIIRPTGLSSSLSFQPVPCTSRLSQLLPLGGNDVLMFWVGGQARLPVASSAEKPQKFLRKTSRESKAEGSALAMAHVPHTTSTETTTFSSTTHDSPPNPARRRTMVHAKLLQFLLCKGDFSEYFVQHMARLLGLDRTGPLMTTCSHML